MGGGRRRRTPPPRTRGPSTLTPAARRTAAAALMAMAAMARCRALLVPHPPRLSSGRARATAARAVASEAGGDSHDRQDQEARARGPSPADGLPEETVVLPAISVPSRHVSRLVGGPLLGRYLASHARELEGVYPRIKVVRDCPGGSPAEGGGGGGGEDEPRKRILLDTRLASPSSTPSPPSLLPPDAASGLRAHLPGLPPDVLAALSGGYAALPASPVTVTVAARDMPLSRVLSSLLPASALPAPSSYEQVGHVAHVNLRREHKAHGRLIGEVMLDRLRPAIRTVVDKVGTVGGPYRTYETDLLAGDDDYDVTVTEHGTSLSFDLRRVYWCTRLEGERTRTIREEFGDGETVADAFCGVGALCIRAALERGCRVVANDLNPDAVECCRRSAVLNGIDAGGGRAAGFAVECGDARRFIMDLGMDGPAGLPDHLMLNYPSGSTDFLDALRWWPSGGGDGAPSSPPRVHVYTFARGDGEGGGGGGGGPGRTAAEAAVDAVADGLLPEGGYAEPSRFRRSYLDELGCRVEAREVRDAAPGKPVVCVSFSATRLLLRRMQGDFGSVE